MHRNQDVEATEEVRGHREKC